MKSTGGLFGLVLLLISVVPAAAGELDWSEITRENRPWAYNWWPGSAVDRENLGRELSRYKEAGLGGIHIIPIYGAQGAESRYIEYLSPKWMEMFRFAVEEAGRLGMGVDMTTGTGWCFGGPGLANEENCTAATGKLVEPKAGESIQQSQLPRGALSAAVAYGPDGKALDLTGRIANGKLDWRAPADGWKVWVVTTRAVSPVKRAGPGGEGFMLNPFYGPAMTTYLKRFTAAFPQGSAVLPRAMYHDSFEYGGNWSPDLFEQFEKKYGYRLQENLPLLFGSEKSDRAARLKGDYRRAISEMMVENVFPQWTEWCRERGILTRNQAHGSPGNILDLYALADIPETEMFGRGTRDPLRSGFDDRFGEGDRDPLVSKFASSAAHVIGRKLVASETGTWLAEHYCETLEELKCLVDLLFVSGVNHVIYHGCCYSPDDAAWPGWFFYASTQMNPRNAIWRDARVLNDYIARCQSILQSGQSDNDVLLYWPIDDLWHNADGMLIACGVHNRDWLNKQPMGMTARTLWKRGYAFDYVSDKQLEGAIGSKAGIDVAGGKYRCIVVPPTVHMPVETMRQLNKMAQFGAKVIFQDRLPEDVPGLWNLEARREDLKDVLEGLREKRNVFVGHLEESLAKAGVARESMMDHEGLLFVRRSHALGWHYLIVNHGTKTLDDWITPGSDFAAAGLMDPMTGRVGTPQTRPGPDGRSTQILLRLEPGHSIILRTFTVKIDGSAPQWAYDRPEGNGEMIKQSWQVRFIEGGPVLPKPYSQATLTSWTQSGDPEAQRFAGTAVYTTTFDALDAWPCLLDLGTVCHSARVRLNGQEVGRLIMKPYRIRLPELKQRDNVLEIEVTNLSANRIRDLDRRKVRWRIMRDANIVNINYRAFDASNWPIQDSGLIGPVRLVPLARER